MELRHLRYFVAVAEELHFGRAADRLNTSQPPLSRQIQELEEEIGFALFVRAHHKVALTAAGKLYLSDVRRVLQRLETAKQEAADVADGRAGHLRVGLGVYLPNGYLSRVLAAFQRSAPRVGIDVLQSPAPGVLPALRQKSIDIALLAAPIDRGGLVVKKLWRDPLVIALPERHRHVMAPLTDLAQLAQENFVMCRRTAESPCRELIEAICREAGFSPRVQQAVDHKQTALDLVAEGLGVTIVPSSLAAGRSNGVRYRQFPKRIPYVEIAVAWRDDSDPEAIVPFVEIAEREAMTLTIGGVIPMEVQPQPVVEASGVRVAEVPLST
jgi:DNA-binding transcriptional LysR family regulator